MEILLIRLSFNPAACSESAAKFDSVSNQRNPKRQANLLKENRNRFNADISPLKSLPFCRDQTVADADGALKKKTQTFALILPSLFFPTFCTGEAFRFVSRTPGLNHECASSSKSFKAIIGL